MTGTFGGTLSGTNRDKPGQGRMADGRDIGGETSPPLGGDVPHVPTPALGPAVNVPSLFFQEQEYRFDGVRNRLAADGRVIAVMEWKTECADCGVTFGLFTINKFAVSRRCRACAKPGKRVRNKRLRGVG